MRHNAARYTFKQMLTKLAERSILVLNIGLVMVVGMYLIREFRQGGDPMLGYLIPAIVLLVFVWLEGTLIAVDITLSRRRKKRGP